MNVFVFIPCFVDQLFPDTAFNMIKVLEQAGCKVSYNDKQTCCGQPAFNAGFWEESKAVANKFIADFEQADYIIMPSASCAGFVKNYYSKMFEGESLTQKVIETQAKVYEFSSFLVDKLNVTNFNAQLNAKATYHDSCAALRELKIKSAPRTLLSNVSGLTLTEMEDNETCCGFGGTFAVKFDTISGAMADQKVDNAKAVNAEIIISTDLSCLMHIEAFAKKNNKAIKTMHIADVLCSK